MEKIIQTQLSHKENLEISISRLSDFLYSIQDSISTELDLALSKLFAEALREVQELSYLKNNLAQTSLTVRNIFELYIITRHVYSNEKALENWYGQLHKDNKDINDAFKTILLKKGFDTSSIEESQRNIDKVINESPYSSKGPFNLKTEATKYGYEDDYDFIYKLSSKLIHPSSMKVNGYKALKENNNYLETLIQTGVYFSQRIEALITEIENDKSV